MASDLEASLIDGGITAAAAKVLANAIANAATGRLSLNRQLEDVTPRANMRLIDSDTRRYVLTNLDHPADNPFRRRMQEQPGRYPAPGPSHPYQSSQPASGTPTLSTPAVSGGPYVKSSQQTTNDVAQSSVTLDTDAKGGQHARLNEATGKVEAVPISLEIEPKGLLEGDIVEEEGRTIIRLRVTSEALRGLLGKRLGTITGLEINGQYGTLYADGLGWGGTGIQVLIPE